MKYCYDKYHIFLLLNSDDLVMLKLYHEHCVSDVKNKKLSIQQVRCFSIKQWVFSLVYELDLLLNMKIHSVISVTNLELLLSDKDLYKCQYNEHLLLIKENEAEKNNLDKEWKSFYIKKLLNQHLHYYEHDKKIIKYLIKWIKYKLEFNEWSLPCSKFKRDHKRSRKNAHWKHQKIQKKNCHFHIQIVKNFSSYFMI